MSLRSHFGSRPSRFNSEVIEKILAMVMKAMKGKGNSSMKSMTSMKSMKANKGKDNSNEKGNGRANGKGKGKKMPGGDRGIGKGVVDDERRDDGDGVNARVRAMNWCRVRRKRLCERRR